MTERCDGCDQRRYVSETYPCARGRRLCHPCHTIGDCACPRTPGERVAVKAREVKAAMHGARERLEGARVSLARSYDVLRRKEREYMEADIAGWPTSSLFLEVSRARSAVSRARGAMREATGELDGAVRAYALFAGAAAELAGAVGMRKVDMPEELL